MNYALVVLFGLVPFWFCVNLGATDSTQINTTIHEVLNSIEWIEVPAGNFLMGSETEEVSALDLEASFRGAMVDLQHTFDSEKPLHRVYLSTYYISKHEITNAQYKLFVEENRRPKPRGNQGQDIWQEEKFAGSQLPVVGVTWFDAQAFAEWIGGSLPTEAQWERAARGKRRNTYPWGNGSPRSRQHANFARRYDGPMPVGQFPKGSTAEGLEDMAGNVWEWCMDEYDADCYHNGPIHNPINLRHRDILYPRVIRGGAWDSGRIFLRSALRFKFFPLDSSHSIGFRVVRPSSKIAKTSDF